MHLGSKSKECLRSHIIVTRAEGEGDNYMRSETLFTYSRGAYTNFLHEERKMRRLFFARRAYNTHFTRRVVKNSFPHSTRKVHTLRPAVQEQSSDFTLTITKNSIRSTGVKLASPNLVFANLHEIWTVQVFSSLGA